MFFSDPTPGVHRERRGTRLVVQKGVCMRVSIEPNAERTYGPRTGRDSRRFGGSPKIERGKRGGARLSKPRIYERNRNLISITTQNIVLSTERSSDLGVARDRPGPFRSALFRSVLTDVQFGFAPGAWCGFAPGAWWQSVK